MQCQQKCIPLIEWFYNLLFVFNISRDILRSQRWLAVVAGMKKANDHAMQNRHKVDRLKKREKKGMNLKYLKSPFYSKAVKTFLRSSLNIHLIKGVNVMLFYLLLYYIVLTTLLLSPPRITLQRIIIQTQGVWPRFFISRFNEVHGRKSWTNCLNTGDFFFFKIS